MKAGTAGAAVTCPHCEGKFDVETNHLGESLATPRRSCTREVAFVAYYLHWPYDQIMQLDHCERRRWVNELSKINQRLNQAAKEEG